MAPKKSSVDMPEFSWSIGQYIAAEDEMATVKTTRLSSPKFAPMRTGDGTKEFDQPGYYVHIMIDSDAYPVNPRIIRVVDGVWCYADKLSELFPVERPPSEGLLLFIY